MNDQCIFCKIIVRQVPSAVVAETDDIIVIKDIHPKTPIHYLIIPKKHVADIQSLGEIDRNVAGNMILMAKKLSEQLPAPSAFKLVSNNGKQAGQHVFHLHLHFLAGMVMAEL